MADHNRLAALTGDLETKAAEFGVALVDAEIEKEGKARYLRLYIDKKGGVTLDDCEAYHCAIADLVDAIDFDFLEVCSPGLDRPLKKKSDFDTHMGELVEVHLYRPRTGNGPKLHVGRLHAVNAADKTVASFQIEEDREIQEFRMDEVSLVRPYIMFDEDETDHGRNEPGEEP